METESLGLLLCVTKNDKHVIKTTHQASYVSGKTYDYGDSIDVAISLDDTEQLLLDEDGDFVYKHCTHILSKSLD